ncbi:MAG: 7,8-didemethyl-8-hydroxy-5-deazariboflavin synthase CofG, partial [Xanthobacteraceae bacterium]|nr:7,8-didemethyl-8-hydroxy-5-deazariboflavin synthase CofG [Xanthobacteraceae bacterium]
MMVTETDHDDETDALSARLLSSSLQDLLDEARGLARAGHGERISYSRKVFIPLTRLCRDVCAYCTFAASPKQVGSAYLSPDEVLAIARAGQAAGCKEALFTLGDKPELRYKAARDALAALGYSSTIDYLAAMCALVLNETGLLPHVNAGIMTDDELGRLRRVSVSQGIMLETAAERLSQRGGPHFGSPDKDPAVRLANIEAAGRLKIPFTTGILIGIGETRQERLDALFALRALHQCYGHLQEVIIQNFRAKPGTRMETASDAEIDDLLWTAACARIIFGAAMNIQVPPNLSYQDFPRLLSAGINDWGGVSPVTPDHVNPEAPWPHLDELERATRAAGFVLVERLAIYPNYALRPAEWLDPRLRRNVMAEIDTAGLARREHWNVGLAAVPP